MNVHREYSYHNSSSAVTHSRYLVVAVFLASNSGMEVNKTASKR
jgi:hypothetical protein